MKSDAENGSISSSSRLRKSSTPTRRRRKVTPAECSNGSNTFAQTMNPDPNSHSDGARLQTLLNNLDIRFDDCTFTYKLSHFESEIPVKKRSRLESLRNKVFNSIGRLHERISCEKMYDKCLFFPINEKDRVKDFVYQNFSDTKLSFVNCKFIKRSTTFSEKVAIRLRKFFGIQFELEYISSTATVDHYTFRLKDILFAINHIQERIIEEA